MSPQEAVTVQAWSAGIQAAAAAIIVVLTFILASIAGRALRESAKQATAASAAIRETSRATAEMRRQRREMRRQVGEMERQSQAMERQRQEMRRQTVASVLVVLDVDQPWGSESDDLFTTVNVRNDAPVPALDLRIELRVESNGGIGNHVYATARRPMLSPGGAEQFPMMSRELFNMGLKPEDRHTASVEQRLPELYHSDRVYVIVSFDTALGAHVVQTYRWFANAHPQNQDHVWEMRSLVIADGRDDPEPFKMEWQ